MFRAAANEVAIFERLVGLETEYAIRFRPHDRDADSPNQFRLFHELIDAVKQRVIAVKARHLKDGVFIGNGGAIWFEHASISTRTGLIEASTPECRGPRQVLQYQRAFDHLLRTVTATIDTEGQFALIKNDRDSLGNIYGAQENYEVSIGGPWARACWRIGLVFLWPLVVFHWLVAVVTLVGALIHLIVAGCIYICLRPFLAKVSRDRVFELLFGQDIVDDSEFGIPVPPWLDWLAINLERVGATPLVAAVYVLIRLTMFRRVRRELLPFLVTRQLFAGSGLLATEDDFQLSDKSGAANCVVGFGLFANEHPVFTFGHFYKALSFLVWLDWREAFDLFGPKQRLQIALGDSNMSAEAEYLRVGTTLLVLDAIETGYIREIPQVSKPIRALRATCHDATLTDKILQSDGRERTAIEIQRLYLQGCQAFVADLTEPSEEAIEVLSCWEDVLNTLEDSPDQLFGRVDWITKRTLMRNAVGADWPALKKIDLKYHELSDEGYYATLQQARVDELAPRLSDVEFAIRNPPGGTPAAARSRFLREFSVDDETVQASWQAVWIGRLFRRRALRVR